MDMPNGQERQIIAEVIEAASGFRDLVNSGVDPIAIKHENSDLRGQVAFLRNRLEGGGRDHPPCWADESGKVEFLFNVELRAGQISVTPAWPARRESAAKALPGINAALDGPHQNSIFPSKVQSILNWSKSQDPECRHYVRLRSTISDAVLSDRSRFMVENFFYKVEVRR